MNYDLAKKLMEAGFPQTGKGKRVAPPDTLVARRDDFVYVPTLAELLTGCGFEMITLCGKQGERWLAMYGDKVEEAEAEGATPEEALALLWLALNPLHHVGHQAQGKD